MLLTLAIIGCAELTPVDPYIATLSADVELEGDIVAADSAPGVTIQLASFDWLQTGDPDELCFLRLESPASAGAALEESQFTAWWWDADEPLEAELSVRYLELSELEVRGNCDLTGHYTEVAERLLGQSWGLGFGEARPDLAAELEAEGNTSDVGGVLGWSGLEQGTGQTHLSDLRARGLTDDGALAADELLADGAHALVQVLEHGPLAATVLLDDADLDLAELEDCSIALESGDPERGATLRVVNETDSVVELRRTGEASTTAVRPGLAVDLTAADGHGVEMLRNGECLGHSAVRGASVLYLD